ncbi:MAG: hypothetical protein PHW82_17670 [Bacteroidales bacterium]|nr:hypothetical protein [Bacteroidales bacterium]
MEYQLQIKPFEKKDGVKYKLITITDIALHTSKMNPTISLGKKIKESFKFKKPGRIYGLIPKVQSSSPSSEENMFMLDMLKKDVSFMKMIQEEEKKGYKILVGFPKEGIPVFAGKDTKEFINSKNGKRIIRGLAKNNNKDV